VGIPYATISSAGLREATRRLAAKPEQQERGVLVIRSGESCEIISPTRVRLGDGSPVDAATVIDCRGRATSPGLPQGASFGSVAVGLQRSRP
jgi:imidazolonepropionase-like amidohydrolase